MQLTSHNSPQVPSFFVVVVGVTSSPTPHYLSWIFARSCCLLALVKISQVILQQLLNLSRNLLSLMVHVHCGLAGDSAYHSHSGTQADRYSLLIHVSLLTMAGGGKKWWILGWLFKFLPRSETSLLLIFSHFMGQSWVHCKLQLKGVWGSTTIPRWREELE